ncbi:HTTM domain-containing protein, partial [Salegentibacter sp.]|uniref:HTTM domain-containing protein n=1 Tax=Salegentibacter sp. TaxID=1903072 RepID=UPI003564C056
MLDRWLFKQVDNSALIVFRVFFGLLITIEAWGAIWTGWIERTLIEPQFTFNFIGFEFLQPLPGNGMLWYYGVMGLFGIFVMLGFKYRLSMFAYGVMWASVYLMQKSSYNNHYYLLMLLCMIFVFLPMHHYFSIDAWRNKKIRSI